MGLTNTKIESFIIISMDIQLGFLMENSAKFSFFITAAVNKIAIKSFIF